MLSKRLVHSAAICAALAIGATACGGNKDKSASPAASTATTTTSPSPTPSPSPTLAVDTLSGEEIEAKAKAAMASLTSVKVDGNLVSNGQKISLDLATDNQKNCAGTVAIGGIGSVEILHNGSGTWMKPDDAFWKNLAAKEGNAKAGAALALLFKGHYLTGPADDPNFKNMSMMCGMIEGITKDDGSKDKVTKGTAGTTNGVKTFSITTVDDHNDTSTVYIATEGQPYLIRMEHVSTSEPGRMDFSDFNKPITVTAPPADNVIDMSVFKQKVKSV